MVDGFRRGPFLSADFVEEARPSPPVYRYLDGFYFAAQAFVDLDAVDFYGILQFHFGALEGEPCLISLVDFPAACERDEMP